MTMPTPPSGRFERLSRTPHPVIKLTAEHEAGDRPVSTGKWVRVARQPLPVVTLKAGPAPCLAPVHRVTPPAEPTRQKLECNLGGLAPDSRRSRARRSAGSSFAGNSALVTAERLRARTRLSYVHVVPFEEFDEGEWARTTDAFSMRLGAAAASFVYRDLRIGTALGDVDEDGQLRIGVSGGRTIFGLFDAIPNQACDGTRVRIDPLVVGPIPYSAYSATSIAEIAAQKFHDATLNYAAGFRVESGRFVIIPVRPDRKELREFNWLLMGIGSPDTGSLAVHLRDLPPPESAVGRVVGDIASMVFDEQGQELDPEVCDAFVQIQMRDLEVLARHGSRRVVAVAGGLKKVKAIATVLQKDPRIINTLITDELTARKLIRELKPKESQVPADRFDP